MPLPETVSQFANAVADYLEEYGHCQSGRYFGEALYGQKRPACVRGAECQVFADYEGVDSNPLGPFELRRKHPVWQAYDLALKAAIPNYYTENLLLGVARWSDTTPTPEVIATLRSLT